MRSPLIILMRPTFPQRTDSNTRRIPTPVLKPIPYSNDIRNSCFSSDFFFVVVGGDAYCGSATIVHSCHINGTQTHIYALWSPIVVRVSRRPKFGDLIFHFWAWKAFTHNTRLPALPLLLCLPTVCVAGATFYVHISILRFVVDDVAECWLKILVKHHGLPRIVGHHPFFFSPFLLN